MPYITTEEVKTKRNLIKKALPEYKLSVRCQHYSVIDISIMEGPIDLMPGVDDKHEQVNTFHIDTHYKDNVEALRVLTIINDIADDGNYTASIDGDYGSIPSFYVHINIGRWDKNYKIVKK